MSSPSPAPRRVVPTGPSATAIFLVLRKMRLPLIVLIILFTVSTVGLTLMPGVDAQGNAWYMDPFDAFYFMSYTATTIGFGEIPYPFTTAQRAWVIVSIYLSVIAWAYAIGSVLALLQDRGFREALSLQRFERKVRRMREPFVIIAGFGQAGEVVARSLDRIDQRIVVLDMEQSRIEALDLAAFHSDVPGLAADAANPYELKRAGLLNPHCEGVIALTNDDEANLAIAMTARLLAPELPVVCRTVDDAILARMEAFGEPMIVDPFNLFGDELVLAVRSPQTYRLVNWLTSGPGNSLSAAMKVPGNGRWIVCGYGRFGSHLAADLVRHGLPVTVVDPDAGNVPAVQIVIGDASDPSVLARAGLGDAVALAAATDNDVTNLSLLAAAKKTNPDLFLIARQNDPANSPLFDALEIDSLLVPTRLIAHEVLAGSATRSCGGSCRAHAASPTNGPGRCSMRIVARCGTDLPDIWSVTLTETGAPSLDGKLAGGTVRLGDLLRSPADRQHVLDAVTLMIVRGEEVLRAPADDEVLLRGDALLLVGMSYDRRALDTTLTVPAAAQYVLTGDRVGQSWVWRTLVDR